MIIYTGTHDNDTLMEWYGNLSPAARRKVRRFLKKEGCRAGSVKDRLITYLLHSPAQYAIIPMQDWLGLGAEARMNVPSRPWGNWQWRLEPGALTPALAQRIAALTELYGR